MEKNEKFCWTLEQVLCDKGKPAPKSNRSTNSCFNYENTIDYLSLFTRVRAGFACTSSASGTSTSGNRRYESGCAGADESGGSSAASASYKPCARATAATAGATGSGRATRSAGASSGYRATSRGRSTRSAGRNDKSRSARRNDESRRSRCHESSSGCFTLSRRARWIFCR